jgi:murein DD-endopeptidase MepM/ murein hydrolase activator NlpD
MFSAPSGALAATLALAAAASGCSTTSSSKMSFADAGFLPEGAAATIAVEPDGPAPLPPVAIPAPESIASELPDGPPIDTVLVRFATEARARRGRTTTGPGFPADAIAAWKVLAYDLDHYLARALPQTPLLELIRARVTVDAEWDYDLRRFGAPPADLRRLVESRSERLAVRVGTARALGLGLLARTAAPRLRWPVEQAGISSLFGMRTHPLDHVRRMHFGVDLASNTGQIVSAAAKGWVVRAGWMGGYGLVVEIRHEGDLTTRYGHLSALLCAPGDAVDTGQPVGLVGRTGHATGPHLHFEVWRGGTPSDPLAWLGVGPVPGAGN